MGFVWNRDELVEMSGAAAGTREIVAYFADREIDVVLQTGGDTVVAAVRGHVDGAAGLALRWAEALAQRDWPGDADLAAQVDAALGRGPVPMLRSIPVPLDDIASTLEGGEGMESRVHVVTGEWRMEELEGSFFDDEDDDPDWLHLVPFGSAEGYRDMRDFAALPPLEAVRDRLERALSGKGAFGRFKDTLARIDESRYLASFLHFSHERGLGRARAELTRGGFRAS